MFQRHEKSLAAGCKSAPDVPSTAEVTSCGLSEGRKVGRLDSADDYVGPLAF